MEIYDALIIALLASLITWTGTYIYFICFRK